ncbi:MAG: insulinase family protein [Clostridiales bacterium]|jgi:predicted Zn-dependent peptidase|nr:insulinase family protein [Clostridiales bacterium]
MHQIHTLNNGLRIVYERLPYLRSASIGVWVKAGSIMEGDGEFGLSHFLEHMAFKGTAKRSARTLADDIDLLGGNLNAATGKTYTCYYAKTVDRELGQAIDLLSDLVVNPLIDGRDVGKERNVILEEIAMEEDSPEDLVHNLLHQGIYRGQTLSGTILGDKEAIAAYQKQSLMGYRKRFYHPRNIVVSVVGRFEPQQLLEQLEAAFSAWDSEGQEAPFPKNAFLPCAESLRMEKDTEQTHLCLAFPGVNHKEESRFALLAISGMLGGGVSSRLFQHLRENKGLVYSIYASSSSYPDCGDFTIYAAASPKNIKKVLLGITEETDSILNSGFSEDEFVRTMAQIRTQYVLSQESAYQRMAHFGNHLLTMGEIMTAREILKRLDRVRLDDVNALARRVLAHPSALALVGKGTEAIDL